MNQAATTPAWVPAIAAIAALLGVLVAQFWQGRREEKRWKREQERWKLEREDQRQKDQGAWAREDRYRFVEYKRELYVDLLNQLTSVFEDLAYEALRSAEERRIVPPRIDLDPLRSVMGRVQLVAPEDIRDLATKHLQELTVAKHQLRNDPGIPKTIIENFSVEPLRALMRTDLGEIPAVTDTN